MMKSKKKKKKKKGKKKKKKKKGKRKTEWQRRNKSQPLALKCPGHTMLCWLVRPTGSGKIIPKGS